MPGVTMTLFGKIFVAGVLMVQGPVSVGGETIVSPPAITPGFAQGWANEVCSGKTAPMRLAVKDWLGLSKLQGITYECSVRFNIDT